MKEYMLKFFKNFRFRSAPQIETVAIVSAPDPRLVAIETVLNSMSSDIKTIVNAFSLNSNLVSINPAFECGCTFKYNDIQLMLTKNYIYIDSFGERIFSKSYEEDISLFSTYISHKTLLELWNEDVKSNEENKEEAIKKALTNLKRKK